jgi:hypothetical protein
MPFDAAPATVGHLVLVGLAGPPLCIERAEGQGYAQSLCMMTPAMVLGGRPLDPRDSMLRDLTNSPTGCA